MGFVALRCFAGAGARAQKPGASASAGAGARHREGGGGLPRCREGLALRERRGRGAAAGDRDAREGHEVEPLAGRVTVARPAEHLDENWDARKIELTKADIAEISRARDS